MFRYIDGIIGIASCSREELENFIHFVQSFHPSLEFTFEISDTSVSFLDIQISINDNRLRTSVYYKPTDSHSYLTFSSSHPPGLLERSPSPSHNFSDSAASVAMMPTITSKPQRCHRFSTTEIILNTSPVLKRKLRPSPVTKPSDQPLPTKVTGFFYFLHTILSTSGSPKSSKRTSTSYLLTPLHTLFFRHLLCYHTAKTLTLEILWCISNSHLNRTTLVELGLGFRSIFLEKWANDGGGEGTHILECCICMSPISKIEVYWWRFTQNQGLQWQCPKKWGSFDRQQSRIRQVIYIGKIISRPKLWILFSNFRNIGVYGCKNPPLGLLSGKFQQKWVFWVDDLPKKNGSIEK